MKHLSKMTVQERIDYLERLDRLHQADTRSNRRDRDVRYGNTQARPYGLLDAPRKQAGKHRATIGEVISAASDLVLLMLGVALVLIVLAMFS